MVMTMSRKVPPRKPRACTKPEPADDLGPLEALSAQEQAEFREFCEADEFPIEADPLFKESLREKLRKLVKNLYGLWFLILAGTLPYN
jgi:hypothetical protein